MREGCTVSAPPESGFGVGTGEGYSGGVDKGGDNASSPWIAVRAEDLGARDVGFVDGDTP